VVAQDANGVQQNACIFRSHRQHVQEDLSGQAGWFEQELSLGASAAKQVGASGQYLTW